MQERKRFNIVDSSLDRGESSIDLELGERMMIPFTGGEIIYAATSSGEKVVIKKPLNNDQARHEWAGLSIVKSTGIFIPTPIALVNYSVDQLAIVSGFVEGDNLYYYPKPEIKVEVGRQVKAMHQNAEVNGGTWKSSGRSTFIYFDKYIFNWSRGNLDELKADSRTASLLAELADTMEEFCRQSKPTFNHNDLHDGQIIVDSSGNPTIIDFGNWIEESWLNDIGYHLFHLVRIDRDETDDFANFLSGYQENEKLSDRERSNLGFYLLFISSRALTYFYRKHSSYLPTAQETHNKVLAHLENETIWRSY